ncbi:phage tail protein [Algoriphagus pacificus]|uniref:Phage tail protein n=1 Tax=Algoriphagus pacificus TaxID=2811234 RepID=A0ABS3CLG9_9BACT|nr:tail fiber protein [Algoriphagus pacificus]MBN7816489.1 phage tail protein [Algoriphagus pacificus]
MTPFIGQIELFGFNFPPRGWATCSGQLLPISSYTALFSLLGTTYGGDGRTTFALPDLQGRVAIGQGNGPGLTPRAMGQKFGQENHTLTTQEIPSHSHSLNGNNANGTSNNPTGNVLAGNTVIPERGADPIPANGYGSSAPNVQMSPSSIGNSGGNLSHNNMQPMLVLNYCIALEGIYPSRN